MLPVALLVHVPGNCDRRRVPISSHLSPPDDAMAVATGFGQLFRGVGQVGGVAVSSAIFQSRLESELRSRITGPDADQVQSYLQFSLFRVLLNRHIDYTSNSTISAACFRTRPGAQEDCSGFVLKEYQGGLLLRNMLNNPFLPRSPSCTNSVSYALSENFI